MAEKAVKAVERRQNPNPLDAAGVLAVIYTFGYFGMVGVLFFMEIPTANREPVLTLIGLMSAVQMAIINFFFGSSKNAEATQRATEQRAARTESTLQETIRAVPQVAAAAVSAAAATPPSAAVPSASASAENMQVAARTVNLMEQPSSDSPKLCPNCKAPQVPGAVYCNKCGMKQSGTTTETEIPTKGTTNETDKSG